MWCVFFSKVWQRYKIYGIFGAPSNEFRHLNFNKFTLDLAFLQKYRNFAVSFRTILSKMKNKISITGDLGSGKSEVGRILCRKMPFEKISTGTIQREIAIRYGMTTLELNQYADTHPEIDDEIDAVFKSLRHSPNAYLFDSRLAWFFIPESFKVYLQVDVRIAAERIMNDTSRKSEKYANVAEAIADLRARKSSENERFMRVYSADCRNAENFDILINTSFVSPETVTNTLLSQFELFSQNKPHQKYWVSPRLLKWEENALDTSENEIEVIKKGDDLWVAKGILILKKALEVDAEIIAVQMKEAVLK